MYLILLIGSVITASGTTYILAKHYFNNRKNIGDLIVTSDEDGQYLSLSLYRDYSDYISDGEYITLQVKELSR